jgi:hypothetical protein
MIYAKNSFLGYFGQNWAKIKIINFANSYHIEVYKKAIKPKNSA